jgi:hypothetical protein
VAPFAVLILTFGTRLLLSSAPDMILLKYLSCADDEAQEQMMETRRGIPKGWIAKGTSEQGVNVAKEMRQ